MGTRDIYIATFITFIFVIATEFLFHEDSMMYILPDDYRDYHLDKLETGDIVSEDEIKNAKSVLEKAEKQKTNVQSSVHSSVQSSVQSSVDSKEFFKNESDKNKNYEAYSFR
jgi:hypothetical protein